MFSEEGRCLTFFKEGRCLTSEEGKWLNLFEEVRYLTFTPRASSAVNLKLG